MEIKTIKELMIPVEKYATVPENATLLEAIHVLEESQKNLPKDRQPHRAVLVVDANNSIVGKVGHLAFLKALEPKYNLIGDMDKLTRAGLSGEFISSMMDHMKLWNDSLASVCKRARAIKVKEVMHSIEENIDEDASIVEAINKIVMWQTLSVLIVRDNKITGILRLSDLYEEVTRYIKKVCQ